jgi:cytochrome c553
MKKLLVLALALGSAAVACTSPTTINLNPSGSSSNEGGDDSSGGAGSGMGGTAGGGQGGDEPSPTPNAHDEYVYNVHPSVIQTCGGCHNPDGQVGAPAFLDYDAELSYELTKNYPGALAAPADSILITKPPHSGPALSEDQKVIVGKWLTMELEEGGGVEPGTTSSSSSGGGGVQSLEEMLTSFAACMDYDIWLANGMDKFPLQQTNGEGACMSCHNAGAGAAWLSIDPIETFEKAKTFPYIMRYVTPIYEGSNPVDLAQSNRFINKGVEPCANPPICHPKYNLSAENKAAFEGFVSSTLSKWQSGACGQP